MHLNWFLRVCIFHERAAHHKLTWSVQPHPHRHMCRLAHTLTPSSLSLSECYVPCSAGWWYTSEIFLHLSKSQVRVGLSSPHHQSDNGANYYASLSLNCTGWFSNPFGLHSGQHAGKTEIKKKFYLINKFIQHELMNWFFYWMYVLFALWSLTTAGLNKIETTATFTLYQAGTRDKSDSLP